MSSKRKVSTTKMLTTTATTSNLDPLTNYKYPPLSWWTRRIFRIVALILFAMSIYPYFFGSKESREKEDASKLTESDSSYNIFTTKTIQLDQTRRDAILDAFKHSYSAYERDAFGFDNYQPLSRKGDNMSSKGPIGYFIVDVLDSLLLLGLKDEFMRAREWVKDLNFDVDDKFNNFEVTIRVLGGLLSAYHLNDNDPMFLAKAVDLADRLLPAFDSPSGIPYSFINLARREGIPDMDNSRFSSAAEAGTLQLEFKYLSEITGNPIYWEKVTKVMDVIRNQPLMDGLVPIFLSPDTGRFQPSTIRLGSRGDSYYEYLLKQYLQTSRTEVVYKEMYDIAMEGIKEHLLKSSATKGLLYTAELLPSRGGSTAVPKQDHLVCFLGGSFMLGVTEGLTSLPLDRSKFTENETDNFYVGINLIKTCMDTYNQTKTGLAPEIVVFYESVEEATAAGREWYIDSRHRTAPRPPLDARNILRPETVESLFIAYRITGNPIYREWGWQIFLAFKEHCKIEGGGFASIYDVDQVPAEFEDRMETFWLAETLKYLYLLFSEDTLIPQSHYVFNTEAHILPIFTPTVVVV